MVAALTVVLVNSKSPVVVALVLLVTKAVTFDRLTKQGYRIKESDEMISKVP